MNQAQQTIKQLIEYTEKQVIGQGHVVEALVIGLLTKGHVLLEGLPGTAKTRSVKALAQALHTSFGRIQFTPDLLPSDVTGTEVYQEIAGKPTLRFQAGPIFNSIVLADEVNRAPAKVQAALLEAMAEGTITVAGETHTLPELFMVLATQNPVEQEGTYPLPEAQMDRFALKVNVDYPDHQAERDIIRLVRSEELTVVAANGDKADIDPEAMANSITPEKLLKARVEVSQVNVSELVENYILGLVMATRHPQQYQASPLAQWIEVGASPRASITLDRSARAKAWLEGRDYVLPDDVRAIAPSVLGHRLTLSYQSLAEGVTAEAVVNEILDVVNVG
ncbi:MoxR family ATPase [Vibrio sp. SCSIO 43136]|uniref:AAA family ATPase n=1 Tax=Vibrio sp. SCSIO 43136 TaxID=2819101 RepID=UPI0020763F38|nr:MoxR family ATPase [Vibrio sp. SCSIO 43136]USD66682.1 MoxR family ATPase [Vibrio sp. SCSIO 43136]